MKNLYSNPEHRELRKKMKTRLDALIKEVGDSVELVEEINADF